MKSLSLSLFILTFSAEKIRDRISHPIGKIPVDAFYNVKAFLALRALSLKTPMRALPLDFTLYCDREHT